MKYPDSLEKASIYENFNTPKIAKHGTIATMTDIQLILDRHGIRLKKSLGQNFLIDEQVLADILLAASIQPSDHVVEIGSGIGVLTKELLKKVNHVTAIELDERMIPLLKEYIRINELTNNELTIINQNALETSFPNEPYKIVANIPYHITSPLLRHAYVESETKPKSITLLIQKEVAERICNEKDFSMLSILVRLFGTPHFIRAVSAKAFLPPPKVTSAIIRIDSHKKPIADSKTIDEVFHLSKIAFNQKRKMLRKTIGSMPDGMKILEKAGIDPTRRPQTVTVEEWIALASLS